MTLCLIHTHRWFKDGVELKNSRKYQIQSDVQTGSLTLTVKTAEESDRGQYQCEVPVHHMHVHFITYVPRFNLCPCVYDVATE